MDQSNNLLARNASRLRWQDIRALWFAIRLPRFVDFSDSIFKSVVDRSKVVHRQVEIESVTHCRTFAKTDDPAHIIALRTTVTISRKLALWGSANQWQYILGVPKYGLTMSAVHHVITPPSKQR
jgi:hypothetical protein